jgi:4-amino-4-deoxy-L-arabinose transferase-like glycosyltransferase
MRPERQRTGIRRRLPCALVPAAGLAVVYALWGLAVPPWGEFPLNDDWAYAWSVRHLLEQGELRISEWAAAAAVPQIYWGAGFARISGGFSFTSLRVATWTFSLLSPIALYALMRQLGMARTASTLAALALVTNPLFVHLSHTFMTDVYYLGLMLLALALTVHGLRGREPVSLWTGSVASACAYLTRQLGVVLPLAAAIAALFREGRRSVGTILRVAGVPALAVAAHTIWLSEVHGVPWGFRLNVVQNGIRTLLDSSTPVDLGFRLIHGLLYLGLMSLPALVAVAAGGRIGRSRFGELAPAYVAWLFVLTIPVVFFWLNEGRSMPYLDGVVSRDGIGAMTLPGRKPPLTPGWLFDVATVIAPFAGAASAALWTDALRHPRRELAGPGAVVLLAALGMVALMALAVKLWDEYLLVLVPASLYLVLREAPVSMRGGLAGALVCVAAFAYALREQGDYMAWNEARWQLGRALVQTGVQPEQIQGGFEWLGWYDFERALPAAIEAGRGDDLFGWTSVFPDRYFLSFEPQRRTRTVGSARYDSRLGPAGVVLLLEEAPE